MTAFTIIFMLAVVSRLAVHMWLSGRQIRFVLAHSDAVPAGFSDSVAPGEHRRAAAYVAARQRLERFETVFDTLVLLAFTVGGGIATLGQWSQRIAGAGIPGGTLHVLGTMAAVTLLGLPFAWYRTFVLEKRFGFNRTTPHTFVTDRAKGWALGLLFGGAVTACVLWIMERSGANWWIVGWIAWLGFSLLVVWAWPAFIAPLFNKFSPLEDAELRARVDALLARCDFQAQALYVMDGSRRSAHGNAYFTGLGRKKRIVFFDTLLATLSPVQIESVLAHELAHFRLRHVPKRLVAGALMSLVGFALLGWLADRPWFYTGLGVPTKSDSAALLLFLFAAPAFTWILSPVLAAWSRRHEYEADAFAARYSDSRALAEALVTLYKDNAATLTPDPIYSAYHDSHPPPASRIARLLESPACRV
jgi:STE24 endopeptidase